MFNIKEMIAQREIMLRAKYDFNKISIAEMQKIKPPAERMTRRAWYNILNGRIKLQKEINDLTFSKDFFAKFNSLSDIDKQKMFKVADDGHLIFKTNEELAEDGIILGVAHV